MKLSIDEWMKAQKREVRVCENPDSNMPKPIFIGVREESEILDVHMKLVSASEWRDFQEVWGRICGAGNVEKSLPQKVPQFFLICN